MAAGLPIVASDVPGVRGMVVDGREGILVTPRDADGMSVALERLYREPEHAALLGRAARSRARTEFRRETMLVRYEAVFRELTDRPPQEPAR